MLNKEPFTCYLDWRQSRGMEWDGPLGPPSSSNASRRCERLAEGKQHGAYNHKASIPPLVGYGLEPGQTHRCSGPTRQLRWKSFPRWTTTCGPAW